MPEYIVKSNIDPSPETKIKLQEPIFYRSPSGIIVTVNNDDKSKIIVEMQIEVPDSEQAYEIAKIELKRLSAVLSWDYDMGIISSGISSVTTRENTGSLDIILYEQVAMIDAVQVAKTDSVENLKLLSKKLERNLNINRDGVFFEDTLNMWQEALKEQSSELRFFLFFRILERMNGGKRMLADQWIKEKEPGVPLRLSNKQTVTVYTYLRDNVNPKTPPDFPYKEINDHINKLRNLVKIAIKEKFGV